VPLEPPVAVPPLVPPQQPSLVPSQALPQQPVVAPLTVTSVPSVIYVGTQNQITKPGDAGISAASHLLLNSGTAESPQKAHYLDVERALSANRESHDKTVEGFSFEVVGIRLPEHHYNFVQRPIAHPETFVFYFDFASSTVHEDQWPVYDRIVEEYGNRGTPITVIGETDGFGSEHFNALLAQHRSEAIVRELIRRGIPPEDIDVQYDIRCCRQDLDTPEAILRSRDRRITWVHFD
jgi:outer membrane protein OmpA-like peptidoglycan-associated protein